MLTKYDCLYPSPQFTILTTASSSMVSPKDFLQAHFSPSIARRIQWDSLRLSNRSYTDEKLAQLHSDVVYTCQLDKKSAYIYLLLEQQTTPDPLLLFQFLQYHVALLAKHLAQKQEEPTADNAPHHPKSMSVLGQENSLPILCRALQLL